MTSVAIDRPTRAVPPERVFAVARLQLTNWPMALGFPLAIMGSSFFVNLLIFGAGAVENAPTGGLASLYIVQLAVGWQGLHQYFGFAVGLNATRRAFYTASLLVVAGESVLFSLFLYASGAVERATGGWGVGLRFFDPLPVTHGSAPVTILVYLVPMLLMSSLALFFGAVSKRWGGTGIFVLSLISIVVIGCAAALVTYLGGWPAVLQWFATRSGLALTIGWPLIPAVLAAAGGWLVLRRAVP